MDVPKWSQVKSDLEIPAKPASGLWTLACDFVAGPALLKIEVVGYRDSKQGAPQGRWSYADADWGATNADGDHTSHLPTASCLNDKGPVGALIGKIGGGPTDNESALSFVVGSARVVELKPEHKGSLYLTMNDIPSGFEDNSGALKVTVSAAAVSGSAKPSS